MKKGDILKCLGALVIVFLVFADQFFTAIPSGLYVGVLLVGIAAIALGFWQEKRKK